MPHKISSSSKQSSHPSASARTTGKLSRSDTLQNRTKPGTLSPDDSTAHCTTTFSDGLPRSVRGQSPEMRVAIRRRQSSESARRKREREAAEREFMERKYAENQVRMDLLEREIEQLSTELIG